MPHKITAKQAAHFAEALAKGTPQCSKIALTVLADKVKETFLDWDPRRHFQECRERFRGRLQRFQRRERRFRSFRKG